MFQTRFISFIFIFIYLLSDYITVLSVCSLQINHSFKNKAEKNEVLFVCFCSLKTEYINNITSFIVIIISSSIFIYNNKDLLIKANHPVNRNSVRPLVVILSLSLTFFYLFLLLAVLLLLFIK